MEFSMYNLPFLSKVAAICKPKVVTAASLDDFLEKIRIVVATDKFFNNWIAESISHSGEDDFWDRIGAEKKEGMSDAEFEDKVKERADLYLEELWWDFVEKFQRHAKVKNGHLIGYRCIALDNVDKFLNSLKKGKYLKGYSGMGIFFSWNQDAVDCHWGHGSEQIVLKALIPPSSIDFQRTARANMDILTGSDEDEITVKKGAKILVEQVLDRKGNNLLDSKKDLPVVACDRFLVF